MTDLAALLAKLRELDAVSTRMTSRFGRPRSRRSWTSRRRRRTSLTTLVSNMSGRLLWPRPSPPCAPLWRGRSDATRTRRFPWRSLRAERLPELPGRVGAVGSGGGLMPVRAVRDLERHDMTDLDAIEKRAREAIERAGLATEGPWWPRGDNAGVHSDRVNIFVGEFEDGEPFVEADILFIASTRTDVPLLAADVLALVEVARAAQEVSDAVGPRPMRDRFAAAMSKLRAALAKREAP